MGARSFHFATLRWQLLGRYYGYPQCCIDALLPKLLDDDDGPFDAVWELRSQIAMSARGGFIPCVAHALWAARGGDLAALLKGRRCAHALREYDAEVP